MMGIHKGDKKFEKREKGTEKVLRTFITLEEHQRIMFKVVRPLTPNRQSHFPSWPSPQRGPPGRAGGRQMAAALP